MNKYAIIFYRTEALPEADNKERFAFCHGADYPPRWQGFNATLNAWTLEGVTRVYLDGHADYKYLPQLRRILSGRGFDVRLCRSDKGQQRKRKWTTGLWHCGLYSFVVKMVKE